RLRRGVQRGRGWLRTAASAPSRRQAIFQPKRQAWRSAGSKGERETSTLRHLRGGGTAPVVHRKLIRPDGERVSGRIQTLGVQTSERSLTVNGKVLFAIRSDAERHC